MTDEKVQENISDETAAYWYNNVAYVSEDLLCGGRYGKTDHT